MSEGARKGRKFLIVCISPDVCLTPVGPTMVPVPYQIVGYLDEACMTSHDVKFGGEPAVLVDQSMVMHVVGNEAGVGGGIKSGHNRWIVEFDEGSDAVHVNGKRVVRHGDRCWMNGRNTRGMVICTDGMGPACSIVNGRPAAQTNSPVSTSGFPVTSIRKEGPRRKGGPTGVTIRGKGAALKPKRFVPQAAALRQAALQSAPYCYV